MYNLVCYSPCNLNLDGVMKYFSAGEPCSLPDRQAQSILSGPYAGRFTVISVEPDEPPVLSELESPPEETLNPDRELVQDLLSTSNVKLGQPLLSAVHPTLTEDEPELVIPLPEDAHWQTVKSFVLDLEEKPPVDLRMVKAVSEKFKNYKAVVEECNRILTSNGVEV